MVFLVPVLLQKRAGSIAYPLSRERECSTLYWAYTSLPQRDYIRLRLRRDLECLAIVYIPQTPQQVGTEGVQLKESRSSLSIFVLGTVLRVREKQETNKAEQQQVLYDTLVPYNAYTVSPTDFFFHLRILRNQKTYNLLTSNSERHVPTSARYRWYTCEWSGCSSRRN
jgi:hypothetical protein